MSNTAYFVILMVFFAATWMILVEIYDIIKEANADSNNGTGLNPHGKVCGLLSIPEIGVLFGEMYCHSA